MSKDIIQDIVLIINKSNDTEEKLLRVRTAKKGRHRDNKKVIEIIENILQKYTLPLHIAEPLNMYTLESANENQYKKLAMIAKKTKMPIFDAVINEVLWEHYHEIEYLYKSINLYTKVLLTLPLEEDVFYTQLAISICRLYSSYIPKEYDFEIFYNKAVEYIKLNHDSLSYSTLFILKGLAECDYKLAEIECIYKEIAKYHERKHNYERAIAFLNGLAEIYKKSKDKSSKETVMVQIAKNYEQQALKLDWESDDNAPRIISLIHKSMEAWAISNSKETIKERERLAKSIIPIKKVLVNNLRIIKTGSIDLSDFVEYIKDFIENASKEKAIAFLAEFIPFKSKEKLLENMKNSSQIFMDFFESQVLDSGGRIKCIVPPLNENNHEKTIAILEFHAAREYEDFANLFVNRYLYLLSKKFKFTEDNLLFLVENNLFVPESRKQSFLKGLVAGFNMDYITALHILVPQVENSIRCLAENCGVVVYKTSSNGVEECLSLESILSKKEVEICLEETFLFNLRLFFVSDYGFGMRANIAHGLVSDNELQTYSALAVWWFILKICCMYSPELHKRLEEQKN